MSLNWLSDKYRVSWQCTFDELGLFETEETNKKIAFFKNNILYVFEEATFFFFLKKHNSYSLKNELTHAGYTSQHVTNKERYIL